MNTQTSRKRKGHTLLEAVFAAGITAAVCIVGISTYLLGMTSWFRGTTWMSGEMTSQQAVRRVSTQLRLALSVTVDGNGQGLSYRMPLIDGNGNFVNPATWDGVNRRIELDGNQLVVKADNAPDQVLCGNIITTDPLSSGGTSSYRIFTAGAGTITRSLTVMIVSQKNVSGSSQLVYGRHRETIYLRNIPRLTE